MSRVNTLVLVFVLIALSALTACSGAGTPTPTPMPEGVTAVEPPGDPAVFTLTSHEGEEFTGEDVRGKYTLFFFGFSNCPDFCPGTLVNYVQIKTLLDDKAEDINFLLISVDNQRDTPETLAEYVSFFNEDFIGATGPDEMLDSTVAQFGAQYYITDDGAGAYNVEHTTSSFLLDPEGRWIRLYSYETPASVIAADIEQLLAGNPASDA